MERTSNKSSPTNTRTRHKICQTTIHRHKRYAKNLAVSSKNIESIFENGQSFDGSSITGYRAIEESDMVLYPDPTTFAVLPWRPKEKASCRLICDVYTPQNKRFEGDPRYILERAVDKASKQVTHFICAPELEFFIVKESENGGLPKPIDLAGYFDFHPSDLTDDLSVEIADTAEAFGIEIEISHHEVALGQNEIDFKYGEALETADRAITMKMCGKVVAARAGYVTTYMPKPFQGINGSGMHCHHEPLEQRRDRKPLLPEDAKNGYLSDLAKKLHRRTTSTRTQNGCSPKLMAKQLQTTSTRLRSTSLPCMGTQKPQPTHPCT
jgi:glutamine synthetase